MSRTAVILIIIIVLLIIAYVIYVNNKQSTDAQKLKNYYLDQPKQIDGFNPYIPNYDPYYGQIDPYFDIPEITGRQRYSINQNSGFYDPAVVNYYGRPNFNTITNRSYPRINGNRSYSGGVHGKFRM